LELEARVKEAHGDAAGALNGRLDAMEMGALTAHGGLLISRQNGDACAAIGGASVWPLVERLNARQARAAARRAEHIVTLQVSLSDSLQEEEWRALAELDEMFRNRKWRKELGAGQYREPAATAVGLLSFVRLLPYSKRRVVDDHARIM